MGIRPAQQPKTETGPGLGKLAGGVAELVAYHQRAMHLADPIFIFILALVLLGPKRTGELAQQLGKLMGEFRKASNDFKYQFTEEMRVAEQNDQLKKQEATRTALPSGEGENSILPPAPLPVAPLTTEPSGEPAPVPYAISAVSATTGEESPIDDHPLLRVDVIPPMDVPMSAPVNAMMDAPTAFNNGHSPGNGTHTEVETLAPEPHETPIHHG